MRQGLRYIKEHIEIIILPAVCFLIFLCAFVLYRLPAEAVLYPAVLCSIIIFVYIVIKVLKGNAKRRDLELLRDLPQNLNDVLKKYNKQDDLGYREIIEALTERENQICENNIAKTNDMTDYYTAWVHQIKTPIASMALTLQGEDTQTSRKLSSDLFRIEQYAEMALCYMKLDSKSGDFVFREYPVDRIVRESVKRFAGQFIDKAIHLDCKETKLTAVTDEKWLSFVIEQIISNALKYTPKGSVCIYSEGKATLCIKDTGIGISKADLPRIFERGYTGFNGRTDKRATGLGLYLCKRICDRLEHKIWVKSSEGEGTTVKIDLSRQPRMFE